MHAIKLLVVSCLWNTIVSADRQPRMHPRDVQMTSVEAPIQERAVAHMPNDAEDYEDAGLTGASIGSKVGAVGGLLLSLPTLGIISFITIPAGAVFGTAAGVAAGKTLRKAQTYKHKVQLKKLHAQLESQTPVNGQVALCGYRQVNGKNDKKKHLNEFAECQKAGVFECGVRPRGFLWVGGAYSFKDESSSLKERCDKECDCCPLDSIKQGGVCQSAEAHEAEPATSESKALEDAKQVPDSTS